MKKTGEAGMTDKKIAMMKKKRKLRAKRRLVIFAFLVVCVAVILIAFKAPFFAIKDVEIRIEPNRDGELTREATQEQGEYILNTSKIRIGANIFSTSVGDAEKRLLNDPEIETAKVQRVFPNKIKITITEAVPIAYAEYGNQYLLIDGKGDIIRVTDKPKEKESEGGEPAEETSEAGAETETGVVEPSSDNDATEKAENEDESVSDEHENVETADAEETEIAEQDETENLVRVEGLEIVSDVAGSRMTAKDDSRAEKLYECLEILENVGMIQKTDCVNFENLADLKLEYDGRLDILLGSYENMEYKLKFIKKVIDDGMSDYEEALLDYKGDKLYVGDRYETELPVADEAEIQSEGDLEDAETADETE